MHRERVEIPAEVNDSTKPSAMLFTCDTNASHGLRRTNADMCKMVVTALDVADW